MALINFENVGHSYSGKQDDYALQPMNFRWKDGGAYALLGPSGCGKSTLLNICSGLLKPSEGSVSFDGKDVTDMSPEKRNIAQVFQFPVLYDSMTVFDNLAFPLRNRGASKSHIAQRVAEVAHMLELEDVLKRRASGLGAELKQKISMGRGLVRDDVSAILFDEPLTVIDPQLKWKLRRQLKEIHKEFGHTLIYVTHDQVEALTFAEQVVVMSEGEIVQVGTPQALFERPEHTFVGYFIGSPGMNFLPCEIDGQDAVVDGQRIPLRAEQASAARDCNANSLKLGIRPEFVELAGNQQGLDLQVSRISEMGQFRLVTALLGQHEVKVKIDNDHGPLEGPNINLHFPPEWICLYSNERLIQTPNEATHGH
ncbi:MAG: ABC transporter ATP-binding protein [Salinisphaera sp.]|jgi:glycerol transport system ATP-binding protein|nr:ABC transporter ATP-binding protein [Salinisphaera sp.]